jgi:RNA polymerase sigma-70 factor (sigma-E family)
VDADRDFAAFASAQWGRLVRSGVFLGCNVEEAQDLAQATLLRCFVAWRRVERADNRDAYVYRVLVNCHHDSRRRRWWGERPTKTLPETPPSVDSTEQFATTDAIHHALSELSTANRQVVVLRYFAELSEHDTAEALRIPPGTVKSRLSRSLSQLASSPHLAEGQA